MDFRAPGADLEERFCEFVESYRARAIRLTWRLVGGDAAAAEDVVQEAFVKAHAALGRFRGEAQLSTWFYRILVRQAHDHRRRMASRSRVVDLLRARRPAAEVTPSMADPPARRLILAAMNQLSAGQREVFVLVHLEGFTVRETAQMLGKSPGTVKSHLHRALASLRSELADVYAAYRENQG